VTIPARFLKIIDGASEQDRLYFEQYPEEREYYRDYVPGEFWPETCPANTVVLVTQLAEGVRTRQPAFLILDGGA